MNFGKNLFLASPLSSEQWLLFSKKDAYALFSDCSLWTLDFFASKASNESSFNLEHFYDILNQKTCAIISDCQVREEEKTQKKKNCLEFDVRTFLGVVFFMNEHRYPNYSDHFNKERLYPSPVAQIMDQQKFELFTQYIELSTSQRNSPEYFEDYNVFLKSFETSLDIKNGSSHMNLFLVLKRINFLQNCRNYLILLYDDRGILLTGLLLSEHDLEAPLFFTKMESMLENYSHKYHTLFIHREMKNNDSLSFLQFLHFLQNDLEFRILCFLTLESPRDYEILKLPEMFLLEESQGTIFRYNQTENLLLMGTPDQSQYLLIGLQYGSGIARNFAENLFEDTLKFIAQNEETEDFIEKLWEISIWREFEDNSMNIALEPIFFIMCSSIKNNYISLRSSTPISDFVDDFIKNLHIFPKIPKLLVDHNCHRDNHYPKKIISKYSKICRVCKMDRKMKTENGRNPKNPRKTKVFCEQCSYTYKKCIILHLEPCFELFHKFPERYPERIMKRTKPFKLNGKKLNNF